MQSCVGSELTYILSETYAYVFEPMLLNLERKASSLGINSYGISLTTLEDVFMRYVYMFLEYNHLIYIKQLQSWCSLLERSRFGGCTIGQKEREKSKQQEISELAIVVFTWSHHVSVNIGLAPNYPEGYKLVMNQFLAMFLKRYIFLKRLWILVILQLIIPLFFFSITVLTYTWQENLPPLKLDLAKFEQPITLLEGHGAEDYSSLYQKFLEENAFTQESTAHLLPRMLDLVKLNKIITYYIFVMSQI